MTVSNKKYVTIYQTIPGMGGESLLVGVYFEKSVFGAEVELLAISIGAGLFMLLLSLFLLKINFNFFLSPIFRYIH